MSQDSAPKDAGNQGAGSSDLPKKEAFDFQAAKQAGKPEGEAQLNPKCEADTSKTKRADLPKPSSFRPMAGEQNDTDSQSALKHLESSQKSNHIFPENKQASLKRKQPESTVVQGRFQDQEAHDWKERENTLPDFPDQFAASQFEDEVNQLFKEEGLSDAAQADLEEDIRALEHMDQHQATACNVALVVTNLLEPLPLETIMASDKIPGEVVETSTGCVIWSQLSPLPDDEFAALLGEERPVHPDADFLARKISEITPYGAVLLVSNLADETDTDPGVHGQIIGRVYYDGEFDRIIAPGPMIACSDDRLEDLLLGRNTPADYAAEKSSMVRLRDMPAAFIRQAKSLILAERDARRKAIQQRERNQKKDKE